MFYCSVDGVREIYDSFEGTGFWVEDFDSSWIRQRCGYAHDDGNVENGLLLRSINGAEMEEGRVF